MSAIIIIEATIILDQENAAFLTTSNNTFCAFFRFRRDKDRCGRLCRHYGKTNPFDKYAYRASRREIEANDFNLNIPRYVDTFEPEEEIDIQAVQAEIDQLESELAETKKQIKKHLKQLSIL